MGTTDNLTLMRALTQRMSWLEQNQKVLAENIANADTPGYQPRELKEIDFRSVLETTTSHIPMAPAGGDGGSSSPSLAATSSMHLNTKGGGNALTEKPRQEKERKPFETAPGGNAVVIEEQLQKMNENFTNHRLITNLYQKNIDMIKMSTKSQ